MSHPQATTLDGLPKRFVTAMRTLFDILDDKKQDCVRFSDIKQFWQDDGAKGLPKGVIESLQKVTPPNGLLTFERFCAGLKICLMRNQMEQQKGRQAPPPTDYRKPLTIRPPSAPTLDNPGEIVEAVNKVPWANTATVRPNNAMASRTLSMPQLLPPPPREPTFPVDEDLPRQFPPPMPFYSTNPVTGQPLYGPPKPPRTAVIMDRPLQVQERPQPQPQMPDHRSEIRSALQNWQKGQILQELDPNKTFMRGRGSGDGKPAGYVDPPMQPTVTVTKKPSQRRREPRRHTLQNGIDYNMLKRIKQIEQEKDMLMQGLASVEKTRDWYLKQIAIVQEKMKYLGRVGSSVEPWSEAQAERLELQRARVVEVNRHLAALTESWERGGLPMHINLALRQLPASDLSRVKHQNHLLTKEVSEKSERIAVLEQEKAAMMRELYQARSRMQHQPRPTSDILLDRGAFM